MMKMPEEIRAEAEEWANSVVSVAGKTDTGEEHCPFEDVCEERRLEDCIACLERLIYERELAAEYGIPDEGDEDGDQALVYKALWEARKRLLEAEAEVEKLRAEVERLRRREETILRWSVDSCCPPGMIGNGCSERSCEECFREALDREEAREREQPEATPNA